MHTDNRWLGVAATFGTVFTALGCGGDGDSGRPPESANPQGRAVVCEGSYVNDQIPQVVEFPCNFNDATGACDPVPVAERSGVACGGDRDPSGKAILPGFDDSDALTDGFCACKDITAPPGEQEGSCAAVCEQIVLESPNFNNGDPDGPWRCQNVREVDNGEKQLDCVHGSIVYLNGGPADYSAQLAGTQTSTGTFDIGIDTLSSSGSGNVDGLMRFSVADRSLGCASGCAMTVSELAFVIHPFSVPGISVIGFEFGGVDMGTSGVINQDPLRGRVFDDGHFVLDSGFGSLVVDYHGDRNGKFSKVLDRNLSGHVDFSTQAVTLDPVTLSQGEGRVRIDTLHGAAIQTPPSPAIATAPVWECETLQATRVALDSTGTTDLEGGPLTHAWEIDGNGVGYGALLDVELALGGHEIKLTSADSTLGRASTRAPVEVVDTTPPAWGPAPLADLTSCDAEVDTHALTIPEVTDGCTGVAEIRAFLVAIDGVPVAPVELDYGAALLPKGQSTVRWVARDGAGNESEVFQTARVGHAVQAFHHLDVRARATVKNASGLEGAVASLGSARSVFGTQSHVGEVLSIGPLTFGNSAVVTGRAASRSSIDVHNSAFIGVLQPNSNVDLGVIPWLAEVAGATFGTVNLTTLPDSVQTLASVENGRIELGPRSRLVVTASEVRLRELVLQPDSVLELSSPSTRIIVRDLVINRGSFRGAVAGLQAKLFLLGSQLVLEQPLNGVSLIAPQATVSLTGHATNTRVGLLVGNVVELHPDVTLFCDRASTLPAP